MNKFNTRCPLQSECGQKKCKFHRCELNCAYYHANARPGFEIEDQEQARQAEWDAYDNPLAEQAEQADAAAEPQTDTIPPIRGLMVHLSVSCLHPHPDNPRKDLGDLTELADSIRANGIFQNLTVVPVDEQYNDYTVIIGHRRLAAAKMAGLAEVPCVIAEMDYREQVRTMLMENIQRADLTVYEQAQGFQLMLDLGDSVEAISKKSGFSKSTVRRRIKLLALDQQKLKASVERGAMLQDYAELDKIEDLALKNEVLDAIGTNNFRMKLNNAIEEEKNRKYIAEVTAAVMEFASLITEVDRSVMRYVNSYETWNKRKVERPDDADTTAYYYTASDRSVTVYQKWNESSEDAKTREEPERLRAEFNRQEGELKQATDMAYHLRADFVRNFSGAKKNLIPIVRFAATALIGNGEYGFDRIDAKLLADLLEVDFDEDADYTIFKEAAEKVSEERPEYVLLASVYASVDGDGTHRYFCYEWENNIRKCVHKPNEELDRLYNFLTSLGYEMSDEEKALRDGTHALFQKDASADSDGQGDSLSGGIF